MADHQHYIKREQLISGLQAGRDEHGLLELSLLISTGSEEWASSESLTPAMCSSLAGDVRFLEGEEVAREDVGSEHRKYEPSVSPEERRHAPDAAEGLRARSVKTNTHLLKSRMAMTMMMMRMTASTGPITHSISGSSVCRVIPLWSFTRMGSENGLAANV
ncbi:hypothetical protein EYF80_012297 [Liparis tanakae]|uniref:Uncharacterized protein n=1 Tax=Liparis tanakae TaxID=230148 RepID=A0A4Z2IJZ5_9TELE|nr:hypothetical protein EYF80_012297 [Liparis tanakae]